MKEYFLKNEIYYKTNEFIPNRLTLVFVHGISGSSSAWVPYEKIFEDKYNVVTYDIRGHGKSKKFPKYSDYEIKNFAYDLHELVSYLNISKFVLITNSLAALIALQYMKLYRETVIANVFTSPEIYLTDTALTKIGRPILKIITGILNFLPFNPKPRGHVDYSKHIGSTDWDVKRNLADMKNTGLRAHFYTLRQSFTPGQEYDLEKINVPTLIIHGEKDSMVPMQNAILMSQKIKDSTFTSIKNIDHNTVHNATKEMSELIESFIEKIPVAKFQHNTDKKTWYNKFMQSYKTFFTNKNFLISFLSGLFLLGISLVTQFFISGYVNSLPSLPVTDLILSNIRTYDVGGIFVYGSVVLVLVGLFVGFSRPKYLPFAMKSIALFTLIRSVFVSLTHISAFPTHIIINSSFFNAQAFNGIFTGNDLFFSGHTGLPFLLALIFWENKKLRIIFLGFSIMFAVVVLLGHIHYSIDVLSAYFITYGIFKICKYLFKKDWQIFLKKT